MATDAILAALDKLSSGTTISARQDGLDELRRLFTSGRNGDFRDDTYHRALESIYQSVSKDKSAYFKLVRAKSNKLSAQTGRLQGLSAALKLVADAGFSRIKFKTAFSILDHIVETLLTPDDEVCEPLRGDYVKILRTLFEYAPITEHLKTKQWQTYVDFVLTLVMISSGDEGLTASFASNKDPSISRNTNPLSIRVSQVSASRTGQATNHAALDDLMASLRALTAHSNAPILTRAEALMHGVHDCLSSTAKSQGLAIETFNNVAHMLLGHNVRLLRDNFALLIPAARRLWSSKFPGVQDQLLVTFSLCQGIIMAKVTSPISLSAEAKSGLLLTLQREYQNRPAKDQLVSEDIVLHLQSSGPDDMDFHFLPHIASSSAVAQCMLVRTIAQLSYSLHVQHMEGPGPTGSPDHAPKRQKVSTPLDDFLQQAVRSSGIPRLLALQVIFFLLISPSALTLDDILEQHCNNLSSILLKEDSPAIFWTLLIFSRIARSRLAPKESLRPVWNRVLDVALRGTASIALARAACLTVAAFYLCPSLSRLCSNTMLQQTLFSAGKTGPASVSDAALFMFISILQSGSFRQDDSFEALSSKVLTWLGMHWVLPANVDRPHNAHLAVHARPELLCMLLSALKGVELHLQYTLNDVNVVPLYQLDERCSDSQKLACLMSGLHPFYTRGAQFSVSIHAAHLNARTRSRVVFAVSEMLQSKLRDFANAWNALSAAGRAGGISHDVLRVVACLCVVAFASTSRSTEESTPSSATQEIPNDLWRTVQSLLLERHPERSTRAAIVAVSVARMSDIASTGDVFLARQLLVCSQSALEVLNKLSVAVAADEDDEDDMMDSFDTHRSQSSQASRENVHSLGIRYDIADDAVSIETLASNTLNIALLAERGRSEGQLSTAATNALVDQILALDATDIIPARHSILQVISMQSTFTRDQVRRLLEFLGTVCLADSRYDRCEAALSLCAKAMAQLARYWTPSEGDELDDRAYEMYEWFVANGLGKSVASSSTLLHLANMLDAVAGYSPAYAEEDQPSIRTSLFKILQTASCSTKIQMIPNLKRIFGRFVLSEHSAIFNDIVDSLPSDSGDLEGLGTRFFILSELGSAWHSILKQATYSLFETAANSTSIIDLQTSCIAQMCKSLDLTSPRQLFNMFASQIFYTWFGVGTIDQIPYQVFSFQSIKDLLNANEAELVAQIALRAAPEHVKDASTILGKPWKVILQRGFARAEAYCIASQMALPGKEQIASNPEGAIRTELGSAQFAQCLQESAPDIIATFIALIKDDSGVERAFEKAGMTSALASFKAMSDHGLPATSQLSVQQPCFRSKFIMEEIHWLRDRLGIKDNETWSPALLVRLYRSILNTAHPAFGSLHAISILRKIRIVIALGGQSATRGYPLESLLHSLRPYLTVFQSSVDAISIYRYLLEQGSDHLKDRLSFLAGLSISIFASLTDFISSSQDSTTQESHFVSTMSKAQDFRRWLRSYLANLLPKQANSDKMELFRSIVNHAAALDGSGTSSVTSHHGSVLLGLLNDRVSDEPLLQPLDFDLSVSILCKTFAIARETKNDILASGAEAAHVIRALERIVRLPTINDELRTWAAQSIGRGVSYIGPFAKPNDGNLRSTLHPDRKSLEDVSSYRSILEHWEQLLWERGGAVAASAELCLQAVASQLDQVQVATICDSSRSISLLDELRFVSMACPTILSPLDNDSQRPSLTHWNSRASKDWAGDLLIAVCAQASHDPILQILEHFALKEPRAACAMLPYAIHLVLAIELDGQRTTQRALATIFGEVFENPGREATETIAHALRSIVYLRKCAIPNEKTVAQRSSWIEVDYIAAARAAVQCQSWHTALLLLEVRQAHTHLAASRSTRRSTQSPDPLPDFLAQIYQHVDDPDFFYAGHQDLDMDSVVSRLNYESAGNKLLSFQSALYDSAGRSQARDAEYASATLATARALSSANLKSISQAIKSIGDNIYTTDGESVNGMATSLLDWDVAPTDDSGATGTALQHLGMLSSAADKHTLVKALDDGLAKVASQYASLDRSKEDHEAFMIGFAVLAEAKDIIRAPNATSYESCLETLAQINAWGAKENFESVSRFLDAREYIFSCVSRSSQLRAAIGLTAPQALLGESKVVRQSLLLAQQHGNHQFCLSRVAYFSSLSKAGQALGVGVDIAAQYDLARTLSKQDETAAAVSVLQTLRARTEHSTQDIPIALSEILAELGQQVSQARLETAQEVIDNYLVPASRDLTSETTNSKAGQTYHIFAAFCDNQLQDQETYDEYVRISEIRESKAAELAELKRLAAIDSSKREQYKGAIKSTEKWYDIDNAEWERVRHSRESLVVRCLENYLQSMKTCDDYPNDTLRVLTIWLEAVDNSRTTDAVNKHIKTVPSWKFAGLVSQLLSRMQDTTDGFQQCLVDLLFRICSDHPYHSLYQVFAGSKTRAAKGDDAGKLRYDAVCKLAKLIGGKSPVRELYTVVHNLNVYFVQLAQYKLDDKQARQGAKISLKDLKGGEKLILDVENSRLKVPAPTMHVALRTDRKYSLVPHMVKFESGVSVAGGISAPKIVTVNISDGSKHKMLMKGGNDDLRQDSIMEQVFGQVSALLKEHPATRKRNLGIRTYKVVPLLSNAGIIEFVQNTMSLQDYLFPAHERYFPNDNSSGKCRKMISNAYAAKQSENERVRVYREAIQKFHPVMRFFFMENFPDPDEWFYKRLNYSRSMAAMSMLGYVLGVGDRHTQNILLDTSSGEVVHIDLGIAFESGRVLPIPETVPFRLTRDMVDGMGVSGLEGVFRRCCNFTLEALRQEQESIMIILDVLRYDPLYSWSVSPLRLAKMHENAKHAAAEAAAGQDSVMTSSTANGLGVQAAAAAAAAAGGPMPARRGEINESAEASRALAVVAKKLRKGLSVEATVNDLIRQATDEKNLGLLFSGWAAYA